MKIQFIRDCPCKIGKKIIHFKSGSFHDDIEEKDANWMLSCGYAIPQVKINKALKKPLENKVLEPTDEDKEVVQPKKRGRPKKDKD